MTEPDNQDGYSHVLFDFDHTLFDTDTSTELAFADAMGAARENPNGLYPTFAAINAEVWRTVEAGAITASSAHTLRFEQLCCTLELDSDPSAMADAFAGGMERHGELYPGARHILDTLAADTTLGLITNGLSHIQRGRLRRLGIEQSFTSITISTEVNAAKPDPKIFEAALQGLGNPPHTSTLIVGDSLSADIIGGQRFGLDTCWYNPHNTPVGPDAQPTHQIHSLDKLFSLF